MTEPFSPNFLYLSPTNRSLAGTGWWEHSGLLSSRTQSIFHISPRFPLASPTVRWSSSLFSQRSLLSPIPSFDFLNTPREPIDLLSSEPENRSGLHTDRAAQTYTFDGCYDWKKDDEPSKRLGSGGRNDHYNSKSESSSEVQGIHNRLLDVNENAVPGSSCGRNQIARTSSQIDQTSDYATQYCRPKFFRSDCNVGGVQRVLFENSFELDSTHPPTHGFEKIFAGQPRAQSESIMTENNNCEKLNPSEQRKFSEIGPHVRRCDALKGKLSVVIPRNPHIPAESMPLWSNRRVSAKLKHCGDQLGEIKGDVNFGESFAYQTADFASWADQGPSRVERLLSLPHPITPTPHSARRQEERLFSDLGFQIDGCTSQAQPSSALTFAGFNKTGAKSYRNLEPCQNFTRDELLLWSAKPEPKTICDMDILTADKAYDHTFCQNFEQNRADVMHSSAQLSSDHMRESAKFEGRSTCAAKDMSSKYERVVPDTLALTVRKWPHSPLQTNDTPFEGYSESGQYYRSYEERPRRLEGNRNDVQRNLFSLLKASKTRFRVGAASAGVPFLGSKRLQNNPNTRCDKEYSGQNGTSTPEDIAVCSGDAMPCSQENRHSYQNAQPSQVERESHFKPQNISYFAKKALERPRSVINKRLESKLMGQFVCDFCMKRFRRGGNLKAHTESVHYRIRNFKCPVAKCPFLSYQKCNVKVHLRRMHSPALAGLEPLFVKGVTLGHK